MNQTTLTPDSLTTGPATPGPLVRVNRPVTFFRGFIPAVRDIWQYRELLANLSRKELKVKYKDSILGFLWSLALPLLLLAIYSVVFGAFLKAGIPYFGFYLFSGLVAWDLFSQILGGCNGSIVGNPGLIKKVYFPREILPLSMVGSGLVNFGLQLLVLVGALVVFRYDFFGPNLLLFPYALLALVIFATAMGLFFSVINVYFRDMEHLLEVILVFWFWMTPIVYSVNQALGFLDNYTIGPISFADIYLMNPMANVVMAFQRAFYKTVSIPGPDGTSTPILLTDSYWPYVNRLTAVILCSLVLVWLAERTFDKAQANFAQEF